MIKNTLKCIILKLIQWIETIEYKDLSLDENNVQKKILHSIPLSGYEVLTDSGYHPLSHIHLTQPYTHWEIKTTTKKLTCANEHRVFNEGFNEVFVDTLQPGDRIQTDNGVEEVVSVEKKLYKTSMFDVTVDHPTHRFYTNGILSHQTVTSSIFIAWYLCFHTDRNIMVVANKLATTSEIVDKIKTVLKHLPFYMKPGITAGGVTGMRFDNGCRLFSQATTKTAAIGFTIHLLFADEFAHIHANFLLPFYRSIYPTLSSSQISRIIICSTPNGMNLFYDIYQGAIEQKNNYYHIRVDWWQVPGRDEEWRLREIGNLGSEELFNQEYGNQFLASSRLLFNSHTLKLLKRTCRPFVVKETDPFFDYPDLNDHLKWKDDFDPGHSDNMKEKFVLSVDLGDGVGRDYSVVNIFQLKAQSIKSVRTIKDWSDETSFFRLNQVGLFRSNVHSVEEIAKVVELLIFELFHYDNCKIVLEVNFKGHIISERLGKHQDFYPEIFLYTKHSISNDTLKMGIKLQKDNRELYCRELRTKVTNKYLTLNEVRTFEELSSFGITQSGKYESQLAHDDVAMTCVNLVALFDTTDFYEMVEEIYDAQDYKFKKAVDKRIELGDRQSDDMSGLFEVLRKQM